jgi:hypothetical protein
VEDVPVTSWFSATIVGGAWRSDYRATHLRYPGAGHLCGGVPGTPAATESRHPVTGQVHSLGGSPAGNAQARADSWPRVLQFLLNGSNAR